MDAWGIVNLVSSGLVGVVSAVGNALVLYIIWKNRSLQNVNNYLIASLAAADFLVGAVGMPVTMVTMFGLPRDFYGCLFMSCMIILLTQVSIHSLVVIAIERFIAIRFPVYHRAHINVRVAAVMIALAWVSGVLVGLVPVFGWHLGGHPENICGFIFVIDFNYMVYFNFMGFVLTPLLVMFATYGYIFYVIKKRTRKVGDQGNQANNAQGSSLKRESKAVQRIFFVLVLFAVCWLPLHILNTLSHLAGVLCIPCTIVAVLLSHLNSAFNPFLYAYGNAKFKEAMLNTIGCKGKESTKVVATVSTHSKD